MLSGPSIGPPGCCCYALLARTPCVVLAEGEGYPSRFFERLLNIPCACLTQLFAPQSLQAAYASSSAASTTLAAFFASSPTPATLASDLQGSTTTNLALPSGTSTINSNLASEAAVLDGAQFSSTTGDGATLKTFVTATKTLITNLYTSATYTNMFNARGTFSTTPNSANYDSLKNAANAYAADANTGNLETQLNQQKAAPSAAARYSSASAPMLAAATAAATTLGSSGYIATANAAISALPPFSSYATTLSAVTLPASTVSFKGNNSMLACSACVWNPVGRLTHPSDCPLNILVVMCRQWLKPCQMLGNVLQVFDAPLAALNSLETAVVTDGSAVQGQVSSTLSAVTSATNQLQTTLLGQFEKINVSWSLLKGSVRKLHCKHMNQDS